jgi:hypothetical protein
MTALIPMETFHWLSKPQTNLQVILQNHPFLRHLSLAMDVSCRTVESRALTFLWRHLPWPLLLPPCLISSIRHRKEFVAHHLQRFET